MTGTTSRSASCGSTKGYSTADLTTRDGCRPKYEEHGAAAGSGAETVGLLTGWSQTRAMYDRFIEELGDRYRVVSYAYRNHGESGSSDNGARISSLAEDLLELVDSLRIDKAHVAGNSMGCSVLWSFIDLFGTDRIKSLVPHRPALGVRSRPLRA